MIEFNRFSRLTNAFRGRISHGLRSKRLTRLIIYRLFILGLFGLLVALITVRLLWLPASRTSPAETKQMQILPNTSSYQIAENLYREGLIRNQTAFLIYLRFSGYERQLKAGTYILSNQMSVQEIVQKFYLNEISTTKFTIPEGYTLMQVEEVLVEKGLINRERWRTVIQEENFAYPVLASLPAGNNRLEGFLFPATYEIAVGMGEAEIVDLMLKCYQQNVTPVVREKARERGLNELALITFASLVEKEARLAEERPIIAGVIFNRLRSKMLLRIDATVQYALGEHRERIYYRDLEIDSPYNTYRYPGLPPGPIASPGMEAIEAVLNPTEHDYYYYVAKPDGSHVFSRTLEEHNRARRQLRS